MEAGSAWNGTGMGSGPVLDREQQDDGGEREESIHLMLTGTVLGPRDTAVTKAQACLPQASEVDTHPTPERRRQKRNVP